MKNSVFISSTQPDLKDYEEKVEITLRRLDMTPVNFKDDGSPPEYTLGVRLGLIRKTRIFIGIIAHTYGQVIKEHDASAVELEYSEAIRRGLPRLMYVVHPDYPWPAEHFDYDGTKLTDFKHRIQQMDGYTYYTTQDDLTSRIVIDLENLVKLKTKNRKSSLLLMLVSAILIALVVLVFAILSKLPEERRDKLLESAGLIQPTATNTLTYTPTYTPSVTPTNTNTPTNTPTSTSTPTLTFTPSITPTPTNTFTPTMTPTARPFSSANGVVLGDFEQVDEIETWLNDMGVNTIREYVPVYDALGLAATYNATLVIWGHEDSIYYAHIPKQLSPPFQIDRLLVDRHELITAEVPKETSTDFAKGLLAYFNGDYDTALSFFTEVSTPSNALYCYRGLSHLFTGDYDSAYEDFTSTKSNTTCIANGLGIVYIIREEYEDALDKFDFTIESDPILPSAYNNRGLALSELGKYDAALNNFNQAIAFLPEQPILYINRAMTYARHDMPENALGDYQQALDLDPQYADIYQLRGDLYFELCIYDLAVADYNAYEEITGELTESMQTNIAEIENINNDALAIESYNRGVEHMGQGDYETAITEFDMVLELATSSSEVNIGDTYYQQALAHYYLGEPADAVTAYSNALERKPTCVPCVLNGRALAHIDTGDFDSAISDYQSAVDNAPDEPLFHNNLGLLNYNLGNYADALENFTNAINLVPDNPDFLYNRGITYALLEDYEAAINDYSTVLVHNPDHPQAYYSRAYAYKQLDMLENVVNDLHQFLLQFPDNADAYGLRAIAYYELLKFDLALQDFAEYERLNGRLEPFMQQIVRDIESRATAEPE